MTRKADLGSTGKPALHAIRSQRLRDLMRHMAPALAHRRPQEMSPGYSQTEWLDDWSKTAIALATDARNIPDALQDVRISPEDRRLFEAYANKLADQAGELADLARQRRLSALSARIDEMTSTCVACHSAFRILPALPSR